MRRFFQRLLLSITTVVVTQISFVSAESIRLVGPNGQVQSAPQYSDNTVRPSVVNTEPARFFGPTSADQTLWSIASQFRPSASVSVQQTLLAIYQLNPQAFEGQNIHTLIPGSTLRIPSLAQISANTNQQAVDIMAAHQAKLTASPVTPPRVRPAPVRSAPVPVASPKTEVVAQVQAETINANVANNAQLEANRAADINRAAEAEVMALEEKNHSLRVMLSQVQLEMSTLKQELGDENRIRSEVEKLLEEERIKAQEAQRLAPSALDNLLANGWLVAALALIPGLLLAIVILLLINRRSTDQQQMAKPSSSIAGDLAMAAPMGLAADQIEDIGDDLLLDDDLFSSSDEKPLDDVEQAFADDDVFADLDEADLDFNLNRPDSEELFVGIDDDGDLDTEFDILGTSANGISVNEEDKALGLDEMVRALDEASQADAPMMAADSFDLADQNHLSDDDIESLLAGDENDLLLEGKVEQSLLDELLASELDALDPEPALQDSATLQGLLNQELDSLSTDDDFELSDATIADTELDPKPEFATLQPQADFEPVELADQTALLDEILAAQDTPIAQDSTELLEELLAEFDAPETDELGLRSSNLDQLEPELVELDQNSTQLLDEVLGESAVSDELAQFDIDANSTELLDELLADFDLADDATEPATLSVEDGTELFDELLDIEQQAQPSQPVISDEFNRDTFIDDLLTSAPAQDPLLEPQEQHQSVGLADEPVIQPEIEVSAAPMPVSNPLPANEFGIPQDDDWLEQAGAGSEPPLDMTPSASQASTLTAMTDAELPEYTEAEALADALQSAPEPALAAEPQNIEQLSTVAEFDEWELPEYTEAEALADALQSAPESALAAEPQNIEQLSTVAEFDEWELPEYTEAEALADALQSAPDPVLAAEPENIEQPGTVAEFDEWELPEYTEAEALADALQSEPDRALNVQPESDPQHTVLDVPNSTLPEVSTEEDVLADFAEIDQEENDFLNFAELALPTVSEPEPVADAIVQTSAPAPAIADPAFDEQALHDLLSEPNPVDQPLRFEQPLDAQTIDSAGMDIDAMLQMGGEDWNGFHLTPDQQAQLPDEVPAEEQDIWAANTPEPQVKSEDWGVQEEQLDFDPRRDGYMTIDQLMAQVESQEQELDPDQQELKLNVGLDEFPDVIGDVHAIDVDSGAEAAGKLDLAKIYIEMNDEKGAVKLLEEAIVDGDDEIRQQAKRLIDRINGRV
ncbi:LysM peptidoglycan-binding domain-containing protein [Vibrio sp. dsl-7]|uniref:LysM peptidoglycan-binding domain-containing protein n=1 Tax=Vibrio chanodichtyis TaxID=3027932 RepID=A0ABT5UVL7_9VIBR|nr:FimV/HubP family polar landmark protein [Vibrio chanodichtyis]MDE1513459.1 LysM peptidoglycan-binding domain-containing protein [Vibrio chanodichtyis]